jgi:hypothetical protein
MSEQIVSALAKMKELYVEQVRDNDPQQKVLEEKMQQVTDYKKNILDPVGRESKDGDINNDGKVNKKDSYLLNRRAVIKTKIENKNIKPPVNENIFYSWRDTVDESLLHEINDISDNKVVKEKNVNNYVKDGKKEPVVVINPEMKTESVLLDSEELGEDFIEEAIDIATEYLCEEGLSDQDVEDLINELGVEEFSEWVMQFGYETLLEWRRGPDGTRVRGAQVSKGGKPISTLKGGAKALAIRATREHKQRKAENEAPSTPSGMTAALKSQSQITKKSKEPKRDDIKKPTTTTSELPKAVRRTRQHGKVTPGPRTTKTVQTKPTIQEKPTPTAPKKGPNPEVRNMVRGAVADAADFISRGNQARKAAREKGLAAGLRSFFFKPEYHEEFKVWVDNLLEEGYDLSEYTWDELYEEYELQEKAVSEQQQKLFGLALSVKRGETSRDKVSPEVLKIVDTMSEKEIRKYASTPHEDVPKKKELAEKVIQFVRESR